MNTELNISCNECGVTKFEPAFVWTGVRSFGAVSMPSI